MYITRSLKAALAVSVYLLPLQALAQNSDSTGGGAPPTAPPVQSEPPTNWVTLGSQYDSGRSFYFGRYSGAVHPGFYGLGDFHYGRRDPWDSGGTNYFEANGANLGMPDRSFDIRVGQQGTWGLGFSYQGIPYYATDSFRSIWTNNGTLVPGVAPGSLGVTFRQIAPAVASLGFPYTGIVAGPPVWQPVYTNSPAAQMFNYNLSTRRDVFTGTGKFQWNDWLITGTIRHEHKSGYQANSLTINGLPSVVTSSATQPTAFTSGMGYFAQPIDYDMDRYDLTAIYGTERLQAQVSYVFSNFTDNNTVFNAVNPYRFTTTPPSPGSIFVPYTQAPSNSAHQIKVMIGYNITPTMRLTGNFAYGLQLQNASFQMASGNPSATFGNVSAANLAGLEPRSSLQGLVQTVFGNLALTAQPIPRLDLRLAYTIDDRSNRTQRSTFLTNVTSGTATTPYMNVPFSYDNQKVTAEAGYRILPQTKVTLNETFDTTYRTYANASFVTSNTLTAKVRSLLLDDVFGSLSYSHQDRVGHTYNSNQTWQLLGVNQFDTFGFRTYFDVSRKRDEVKGTLDLSPLNNLSASLVVRYANDRYPDGSYGLRNNRNISFGPDVNWQATPALSIHGYYTYQQIYYNQSSVYESSTFLGLPPTPSSSQFVVPWTSKTTNSVHTAGLTMDWQAIKDVLKFSFDYNFAYGDTAYALGDSVVFFGPAVAGSQITKNTIALQPLPDVTSMLNMVSLRGEYTFRPNTTLMMGYAYERFTSNDFMVGVTPTNYAGALLPGTPNQADSVHIVYAMLRFKF